jgi:hypothetical protein
VGEFTLPVRSKLKVSKITRNVKNRQVAKFENELIEIFTLINNSQIISRSDGLSYHSRIIFLIKKIVQYYPQKIHNPLNKEYQKAMEKLYSVINS